MKMKSCALCLLTVLLMVGCACCLRAEQRPPKDEAEAEQWVKEGLSPFCQRTLSFPRDQQGLVSVTCKNSDGGSAALIPFLLRAMSPVQLENGLWTVHFSFSVYKQDFREHLRNRDHVEHFREGLLFLARESQKHWDQLAAEKLDALHAQAEAWRALVEKPKMPDDAYAHKVLAEDAYRNKDLVKALNEYQLGIQIFPTWPEGQFNAGLIAAELEDYRVAVQRMKEYLLLVPDAPDAQAAKDKIIIWQDKIVNF